MGAIRSADALVTALAWRASGAAPLARRLVQQALGSDEDAATIAQMQLVQAGDRGLDIVEPHIRAGEADLVTCVVSIGGPRAEALLVDLQRTAGPEVAAAAAEGLRLLQRGEGR